MDNTEYRLKQLDKKVEKMEDRIDSIEKEQSAMNERLQSNEKVTDKISDLVDEMRINNVTITNFMKKTESERQLLYGAIVAAVFTGLVSLIVAVIV